MKMMIVASLLASTVAFANPTAPAAGTAAPATMTETPAATTGAMETPKKMSKKEAKATCKAEGKKGKEMKNCVKEKTM